MCERFGQSFSSIIEYDLFILPFLPQYFFVFRSLIQYLPSGIDLYFVSNKLHDGAGFSLRVPGPENIIFTVLTKNKIYLFTQLGDTFLRFHNKESVRIYLSRIFIYLYTKFDDNLKSKYIRCFTAMLHSILYVIE